VLSIAVLLLSQGTLVASTQMLSRVIEKFPISATGGKVRGESVVKVCTCVYMGATCKRARLWCMGCVRD
jgi:hypothetical protein